MPNCHWLSLARYECRGVSHYLSGESLISLDERTVTLSQPMTNQDSFVTVFVCMRGRV